MSAFELPDRQTSLADRRTRVFTLLADGLWHSTSTIESPDTGGSQGTRRLRELRAQGIVIEKRKKVGSDEYEYRLKNVHGRVPRVVAQPTLF